MPKLAQRYFSKFILSRVGVLPQEYFSLLLIHELGQGLRELSRPLFQPELLVKLYLALL